MSIKSYQFGARKSLSYSLWELYGISIAFAVRSFDPSTSNNTMKNSRFLCSLIICLAVYFCQEVPVLGSPSRNEALVLMEKEKFAPAAKHLESLVRTSAPELDVHEIHHALGYCYEKLKKWEQAAKYYEMAASPGYILADYAIYRLAQIHQERENHEKAIVWYRRLIERYPQSHNVFDAKYEIASVNLQQDKHANAIEFSSQLIANERSDYFRRATYLQAEAYEGLRKWEDALHAYQRLIDADKSDGIARDALMQIRRLVKAHPRLKVTRSQRVAHGIVLYNHGRFTDAIAVFRKVAPRKNDKLTGQAVYFTGRAYHRRRKYDLAIREYNKVVTLYPASSYLTRALYQTTICYRRKKQPHIAQNRLKAFVKDYSWSELAHKALFDLGWVQENEEHFDEALGSYRQLTLKYPSSRFASDAYWRIGWIQFKRKQYDESMKTFASLMRLFPRNRLAMAAHFWTAKCYERKNQHETAKRIYREVLGAHYWYYSSRAEAVLRQMGEKLESTKNSPVSNRVNSVPNHSKWKQVGLERSARIGKLMELKFYDDAITEIRGEVKSERGDQNANYYNLIVCYQKKRRFNEAYDYAQQLSTLASIRDENRAIPLELYQLLYPIYYRDIINKYSKKYEMDPLFVAAMILEESRFGAESVSWAGAMGLMQIMPQTGRELARQLKIRRFEKSILLNPSVNIQMGTKYMKFLMDRFQDNHALVAGAYNGGPGRMGRWMKERGLADLDEFIEDIAIDETRRHIKKVIDSYYVYQKLYPSETELREPQIRKTNNAGDNKMSGR